MRTKLNQPLTVVRYRIGEDDDAIHELRLPGQYSQRNEIDCEIMLREGAKDYYENHGGWEAEWPLTIALINPDGSEICRALVHCELEPSFSMRDVKFLETEE